MFVEEARAAFEALLARSGHELDRLRAEIATRLMIEFYVSERADDVDLLADGDMLLFQWGTYSFGDEGSTFRYDITRQLIRETGTSGLDEDIWQLSLILYYEPNARTASAGSGGLWCHVPEDVDGFEESIASSRATVVVLGTAPLRVELLVDQAG